MIRWCMYCQRFVGEVAPHDDPRFSHGICAACEAREDRGEPVLEESTAQRALMTRILASATAGDEHACAALIDEARAVGLDGTSLCVGLLQPALYQAGLDWQGARMSVAAEHRFTSWCDRVFSLLPPIPRARAPVDLLVLAAPGNTHDLGPRMAAYVLAARGFHVDVVVPALPLGEILALIEATRPAVVGFSCAITSTVPATCALIARLRDQLAPSFRCRFLLSGFAFRIGDGHGGGPPQVDPDVEILVDLEAFHV